MIMMEEKQKVNENILTVFGQVSFTSFLIKQHWGPYLNDVYTEGGGGVNEMQT